MEVHMRAFALALVAAAVLAVVWSFGLNALQETAAQKNTSSGGSVRLDHQEAVNLIGREG